MNSSELLFNLFRPWEWTEGQGANVINIFGAIGTVGALLYAFYLERKNSKKINDLGNIVIELRKQTEIQKKTAKSEFNPSIKISEKYNAKKSQLTLIITNNATPLVIKSLKMIGTKNIVIYTAPLLPVPIRRNERVMVMLTAKQPPLNEDVDIIIGINAEDIYQHSYTGIVSNIFGKSQADKALFVCTWLNGLQL